MSIDERSKCYECHQLNYINFLTEITGGKEYEDMRLERFSISDIDSLNELNSKLNLELKLGEEINIINGNNFNDMYLMSAYENIRILTEITGDGKLRKSEVVTFRNLVHRVSIYQDKVRFNHFVKSIVGYSIWQFLSNNDRRKLKQCPYCEKFYIAKDIKRQRCYSKKCQREYERQKKQKQREDDPEKYL